MTRPAHLARARYVVVLINAEGRHCAFGERSAKWPIYWTDLWNQHDEPFEELFRGFSTFPSKRHPALRAMVDVLSQTPLNESGRPIKAVIYSTSLERDIVMLTEEKIILLLPPLDAA